MGTSLDFGKITTIVLGFFIVAFFFGPQIKDWYDHKDDYQMGVNQMIYTKQMYETADPEEQAAFLQQIENSCVIKHHKDGLSCSDTAYWLANNLDSEGVDSELAMMVMEPCTQACKNKELAKAIPQQEKTQAQAKEKSGGTKWIWER